MSDPLSSVTVIKTNPDDPRAPITRTYSVSDSTEHVFKGHIPGHYYTKQVVRFFSHLNSLFRYHSYSFWQEPPVYNHWQPSHRTMNVYKWPLDYIQPTNSWRHRDFYYGYPMKTPNRIIMPLLRSQSTASVSRDMSTGLCRTCSLHNVYSAFTPSQAPPVSYYTKYYPTKYGSGLPYSDFYGPSYRTPSTFSCFYKYIWSSDEWRTRGHYSKYSRHPGYLAMSFPLVRTKSVTVLSKAPDGDTAHSHSVIDVGPVEYASPFYSTPQWRSPCSDGYWRRKYYQSQFTPQESHRWNFLSSGWRYRNHYDDFHWPLDKFIGTQHSYYTRTKYYVSSDLY